MNEHIVEEKYYANGALESRTYRNCARKPIPSLLGFSRGMNGACVAKCVAVCTL